MIQELSRQFPRFWAILDEVGDDIYRIFFVECVMKGGDGDNHIT